MKKKIAIQGFEGSFHQAAARRFFGNDVEVICCSTFRDVVKIAGDKTSSDGGLKAASTRQPQEDFSETMLK